MKLALLKATEALTTVEVCLSLMVFRVASLLQYVHACVLLCFYQEVNGSSTIIYKC